jgi:DNA-binding PadR family transcriptional regulator
MTIQLDECPCSGKNMSNLAAPWILLTIYNNGALHGYELTRLIRDQIESVGIGLNQTGLYRHLNVLEKRGMLVSKWDVAGRGPARRQYTLTAAGRQCLSRWMRTLSTQMTLIGTFLDRAREVLEDEMLVVGEP